MSKDPNLINTYNNKKDLYATIGSFVFHKDYWECMEHWEDGSPNPTGKEIRKKCKGLVLGIMYGMGAKLMASILNVTIDECREILEEFYKMFPAIKDFTQKNEEAAKTIGYVEDYMGRRRHLPDAQLSPIEFKAKKSVITNIDTLLDCSLENCRIEVDDRDLTREWTNKWLEYSSQKHKKSQFDVKNDFKELAKNNGIEVRDNGGFISRSMTQCTNARIQGSAASLTKKAMVNIFNDSEMGKLGFKLLVPVHDELLGECPIRNVDKVCERLSYLMIDSAKPECSVDMKVDTYTVNHWYADDISNQVHDEYMKLLKSYTKDDAYNKLRSSYTQFSDETFKEMCEGIFDTLKEDL